MANLAAELLYRMTLEVGPPFDIGTGPRGHRMVIPFKGGKFEGPKLRGEVLITAEPGILQVRRPFYNAVAPDSGTRKYYEKVFFKNTHATLSLTESKIKKTSDPSGKIGFALETALNGSGTNGANNRQVAPAGLTFDSSDKSVANNGNHTAGTGQGVWLELTLLATDPALKSSYTIQESGVTA